MAADAAGVDMHATRGGGRSLAIIGGGWAGLAAAVEGVRLGQRVTLFEMARRLGGRARCVEFGDAAYDNGQHILIGAYRDTLALLRALGVDEAAAFERTPLQFTDARGVGLRLPAGPPAIAFVRAVLAQRGWRLRDRLALLATAARWRVQGFHCAAPLTVSELTARLPAAIRAELIDPLCVAALNTPASDASARVFLRVLNDALFAGPGSSDLLLPRVGLDALLPAPAAAWLNAHGAELRLGRRVRELRAEGDSWHVDGERFDRVVLACTSTEAARLTAAISPSWSAQAAALAFEPIVTVYAESAGARLPESMLALVSDRHSPAQFVFDRGRLGGPAGLLAFVTSGAQHWVDRGTAAIEQATLEQARSQLALDQAPTILQTVIEKRATFRCAPMLQRPPQAIAARLHAAGDYIAGPYPAVLEGAVRSGLAAARNVVST